MNVAIFTDNALRGPNGTTTTLHAVLAHAPSHVRARIYTCGDDSFDRHDCLALKARRIGSPFREFLHHALHDAIELIHVTTSGPVGMAAMWVAHQAGIPMVGSLHSDLAGSGRIGRTWPALGALTHRFTRWPYATCRRVLVPSEAFRASIVGGAIDPARVSLWRRGVCSERFTPLKRSRSVRESWGAPDSCPVILHVGRLSPDKNVGALVSVQASLTRAGVPHRMVFVGDGPLRPVLEERCRGAVFMNTLGHEEVAVAMASADVLVCPSVNDTAGTVVLEAQASGLPVLVSDVGGAREHMVPGKTGETCSSPSDFCRQTIRLARRPASRRWLGAAARAFAAERSWEQSLASLSRAYAEASVLSQFPGHTAEVAAQGIR
jgi:glycosyltransferase involved in cell wall biosynthesis